MLTKEERTALATKIRIANRRDRMWDSWWNQDGTTLEVFGTPIAVSDDLYSNKMVWENGSETKVPFDDELHDAVLQYLDA